MSVNNKCAAAGRTVFGIRVAQCCFLNVLKMPVVKMVLAFVAFGSGEQQCVHMCGCLLCCCSCNTGAGENKALILKALWGVCGDAEGTGEWIQRRTGN